MVSDPELERLLAMFPSFSAQIRVTEDCFCREGLALADGF